MHADMHQHMKPKPAPQPEFVLENPPVKGAPGESKISWLLNAAKVRRYALDMA